MTSFVSEIWSIDRSLSQESTQIEFEIQWTSVA